MYCKLILRNVRRSAKDYLIYLVTMTICVTLFYAFLSVSSRYYHPDLGAEYDISLMGDGMKLAIMAITLLLLFLIRYVNSYMLLRRKKEFAMQAVMGMEQRTIGCLFFAETLVMGATAVVCGILLGMLCSQFLTAMLLSVYEKPYRLSWMLFPDTAALTLVFFTLSFSFTGLFNLHSIRKIKVIDMLYADRYNEKSVKRSHFMPAIVIFYLILAVVMVWIGIVNRHFFFDKRMALPVHLMFWGNILMPALTVLLFMLWLVMRKRWKFDLFILIQLISAIVNACFAASVPQMKSRYLLSLAGGNLNQYLMFLLADLSFVVCCIIYLAGSFLEECKERWPSLKYKGCNLFFFGQIITKLSSSTKAMILICLTLALSIFLFAAAPALAGWSEGYLKVRSQYDIQISSQYNTVYDEADLPAGDYELVSEFLSEQNISPEYDLTFSLYLPKREDFHNRMKLTFPAVAISLSDYNAVRQMCGYPTITLKEGEFTTQWNATATQDEIHSFLASHTTLSTDREVLTLSENPAHTESLGTTLYNLYTNMLYVIPDTSCQTLLSVIRNRYISFPKQRTVRSANCPYVQQQMPRSTSHPYVQQRLPESASQSYVQENASLSYEQAVMLRERFAGQYSETGEGVHYFLRTRTEQINDNKASTFILRSAMLYSAVVLMVICLTILALQQLMDAPHYKYRFGVLRKMGVEESDLHKLILKQLLLWFGLPVLTAAVIAGIVIIYFFRMISVQIAAYVGFDTLLAQVGGILLILLGLLACYFVSTWVMFKRSL